MPEIDSMSDAIPNYHELMEELAKVPLRRMLHGEWLPEQKENIMPEDEQPTERDTHFAGSAGFVAREIEALEHQAVPGTDLSISYGHWKEAVKIIIAQYAYDLAVHAVSETIGTKDISHIPDLTEWPKGNEHG